MTGATRATPDWLTRPEVGLCPCGCVGRRRKGDFVEKTIAGSSELVRRTMFADEVAERGGALQRLDPRVKVVSLLVLLVAAATVRREPVLLGLYALTLVLAVSAGLTLRFFLARVWLFVPVFTAIVVAPATLNLVTPGHVVVSLGTWFGTPVGLTQEGLTAALLIVTRVATSVSLAVLLTLTTPWPRLLNALQALHVPQVFVLVTGMGYRYVFSLLGSVDEMYTARRARTVGRESSVKNGRSFVSASAGALFARTYALSEEVHMAMVARGYSLARPTSTREPVRRTDWVSLVFAALLAAIAIGLSRA